MHSVASVDSTVAYLTNRIQNENHDVQLRLQGFDLVVVNLQRQFPHNRTFSGTGKGFIFGCDEDHLLEEFAKRRCNLIGIFDNRPIKTQLLEDAKKN
jgi:hypothetical protein